MLSRNQYSEGTGLFLDTILSANCLDAWSWFCSFCWVVFVLSDTKFVRFHWVRAFLSPRFRIARAAWQLLLLPVLLCGWFIRCHYVWDGLAASDVWLRSSIFCRPRGFCNLDFRIVDARRIWDSCTEHLMWIFSWKARSSYLQSRSLHRSRFSK